MKKILALLVFALTLLVPSAVAQTTYEPVVYPAQQTAVGNAALSVSNGTYTFSNNLFSASFVQTGDQIKFGGCSAMSLKAGTELFTVTFGDGTTVKASQLTSPVVTSGDLTGNDKAVKGSDHYNGKYLQAVYTYTKGEATLTLTWRAELRDGSHYLRTDLTVRSNKDIAMKSFVPMQYIYDTTTGGTAPEKLGNVTYGNLLMNDKIFAGLETPMGQNSVGDSDGETYTAFPNVSGWTKDLMTWTPSSIPSALQSQDGVAYTAANYLGTQGLVTFSTSGSVTATFQYQNGACGLWVAGIELVNPETGTVESSNYNLQFTGGGKQQISYTLANVEASKVYLMRFYYDSKKEGAANRNTSNGNITWTSAPTAYTPAGSSAADKYIKGLWSRNTTLYAYAPDTNGELGKDMEWNVSTVVGLVNPAQKRRSYLAYHERERAVPWRPFPLYNSWYELNINRKDADDPANNMTTAQAVGVVNQWKEHMYNVYGEGIQAYVWDDGWDQYGTWEPHANFTNGFAETDAIAKTMNTGIGCWLGPRGGYGHSADLRRKYWTDRGSSHQLSQPDFFKAFMSACSEKVKNYDFRFFKFDGISTLGTAYGPQNEEDAEGIITVERLARKMREDLFFNTTVGTWASPFWFHFADAIWRQENDHGTIGNGANNREQWITYRDNLVHKIFTAPNPYCPINSIMTHGFILSTHGGSSDRSYNSVLNELRCAFCSGDAMVELYADADLLNTINGGILWEKIAECIKWQKDNADVLPDVHWVGGDPWDETNNTHNIYGWASWNGTKATLTLRNGDPNAKTYTTTLREALDIPSSFTGKIYLKAAFGDQFGALKEICGIDDNTAIDPTQSITFTLPGSSVYVFNGKANAPVEAVLNTYTVTTTDMPNGATVTYKGAALGSSVSAEYINEEDITVTAPTGYKYTVKVDNVLHTVKVTFIVPLTFESAIKDGATYAFVNIQPTDPRKMYYLYSEGTTNLKAASADECGANIEWPTTAQFVAIKQEGENKYAFKNVANDQYLAYKKFIGNIDADLSVWTAHDGTRSQFSDIHTFWFGVNKRSSSEGSGSIILKNDGTFDNCSAGEFNNNTTYSNNYGLVLVEDVPLTDIEKAFNYTTNSNVTATQLAGLTITFTGDNAANVKLSATQHVAYLTPKASTPAQVKAQNGKFNAPRLKAAGETPEGIAGEITATGETGKFSIAFPEDQITEGEYEVTIPEGTFYVGTTAHPVAELKANYTVEESAPTLPPYADLPLTSGVYEIQNSPTMDGGNRGYLVDYTSYTSGPSLAECKLSPHESKHPANRNDGTTTSSKWYIYNDNGTYYIVSLSTLGSNTEPLFLKPGTTNSGKSTYSATKEPLAITQHSTNTVTGTDNNTYHSYLISNTATSSVYLSAACGTNSTSGAVTGATNANDGGSPWVFIPCDESTLTTEQVALRDKAIEIINYKIPTAGKVYTIKAYFNSNDYTDIYLTSNPAAENLLLPMPEAPTVNQSYWVAEASGNTDRPWKFKSGYGYAKYLDWQNGGLSANGDNFGVLACGTVPGTYHLNVSNNNRNIGTWGNNNNTKKGFGAVGSGGCWAGNYGHYNGLASGNYWTTDYIIEEVKNVDVYTVTGVGSFTVTGIDGYSYANTISAGGLVIVPSNTNFTIDNLQLSHGYNATIDTANKTITLERSSTDPLDEHLFIIKSAYTGYGSKALYKTSDNKLAWKDYVEGDNSFVFTFEKISSDAVNWNTNGGITASGRYAIKSGTKYIGTTGWNGTYSFVDLNSLMDNGALAENGKSGIFAIAPIANTNPQQYNIATTLYNNANDFSTLALLSGTSTTAESGNASTYNAWNNANNVSAWTLEEVQPVVPVGTHYVTFEGQQSARPQYLYNDFTATANSDKTFQATTQGVATNGKPKNNFIWKIESDGLGNLTFLNGEGSTVIKADNKTISSLFVEKHPIAGHENAYYLKLNSTSNDCLNQRNASDGCVVTTWQSNQGGGNALDNLWNINEVETSDVTVYTVEVTGCDKGYATYDGQNAKNGGFFLVSGSEQPAVTAASVLGYTPAVTINGNVISVTYTPNTVTYTVNITDNSGKLAEPTSAKYAHNSTEETIQNGGTFTAPYGSVEASQVISSYDYVGASVSIEPVGDTENFNVNVTYSVLYHPTWRANPDTRPLKTGTCSGDGTWTGNAYMIYDASIQGNTNRSGFEYGGDSRVCVTYQDPNKVWALDNTTGTHLINNDHPVPFTFKAGIQYLWVIENAEGTADGEVNNTTAYYLRNVANGKYYDCKGYPRDNKDDATKLYIQDFQTGTISGANSTTHSYSQYEERVDAISDDKGIFLIGGQMEGHTGASGNGNCWNGDENKFNNWETSSPFCFYQVVELTDAMDQETWDVCLDYAHYIDGVGDLSHDFGTFGEKTADSEDLVVGTSTFSQYVDVVIENTKKYVRAPKAGRLLTIKNALSLKYMNGADVTNDYSVMWYNSQNQIVSYNTGLGFNGVAAAELPEMDAAEFETHTADQPSFRLGTMVIKTEADKFFSVANEKASALCTNDANTTDNSTWFVDNAPYVNVSFGSANNGFTTFLAPEPMIVPDGVTAYTVTKNEVEEDAEKGQKKECILTLTTIKASEDGNAYIPANTAVILEGTAGETVQVKARLVPQNVTDEEYDELDKDWDGFIDTPALTTENVLKALDYSCVNPQYNGGTYEVEGQTKYIYSLANGAFSYYKGTKIQAFKCFLALDQDYRAGSGNTAPFRVIFEDGTEAIHVLEALSNDDSNCFDLSGRRVQSNARGLLINNGKKMLRK